MEAEQQVRSSPLLTLSGTRFRLHRTGSELTAQYVYVRSRRARGSRPKCLSTSPPRHGTKCRIAPEPSCKVREAKKSPSFPLRIASQHHPNLFWSDGSAGRPAMRRGCPTLVAEFRKILTLLGSRFIFRGLFNLFRPWLGRRRNQAEAKGTTSDACAVIYTERNLFDYCKNRGVCLYNCVLPCCQICITGRRAVPVSYHDSATDSVIELMMQTIDRPSKGPLTEGYR